MSKEAEKEKINKLLIKKVMVDTKLEIDSLKTRSRIGKKTTKKVRYLERYYEYLDNKFN